MKQRVQNEYILEQYEPMTTKYWKRNKKPNINLLDCPFAADRQLEDQRFLIEQNKNPRGLEPGKNDKPRSIKIAAKIGVSNSLNMKAKVVNKIVREASGVHNYTLVPPIIQHKNKLNEVNKIDPDTHPLMKPYREQSNTNPVMCSFGHRPKSASRTFHPGTMKIKLLKGEIAQAAPNGRNGFGLPPSVLSKLLHAPKIYHPNEEFNEDSQDENNNTAAHSPHQQQQQQQQLYDPHDLFLSNEQLFEQQQDQHLQKKKSEKKLKNGIKIENSLKIGEQSWSTTLPNPSYDEMGQGETGGGEHIKKTNKKNSKYSQKYENETNWNNHFHVIEKLSNERFELKKSGIAELKLLPLKERLTRFAAISVRDSIPQPFCCEKKLTDSLILNGKASDPGDLYRMVAIEQHHKSPQELTYNRIDNPFYDAEVEEDLRVIQRRYREKEEKKRNDLRKKMIKAAIASIPHVEYHPDDVVIEMAQENEKKKEEEEQNQEQEQEQEEEEGERQRKREVEEKERGKEERKERKKEEKRQKKLKSSQRKEDEGFIKIENSDTMNETKLSKQKGSKRHQKNENEKILNYQRVYGSTLSPLEVLEIQKQALNKSLQRTSSWKKTTEQFEKKGTVVDENDPIFSHVMQPFEDYFTSEEEKEKMRREWEKERKEREELERMKIAGKSKDMNESNRQGEGEGEGEGVEGREGEDPYLGQENEEQRLQEEEEEEKYDDQNLFHNHNVPFGDEEEGEGV